MDYEKLIYQYFQEYSEKSIDEFYKLFDLKQIESIFEPSNIPQLLNTILRIETDLEDEHSHNIDWSIKDEIIDAVLILAFKSKETEWLNAICVAMNSYASTPREYLKHINKVILSEFLFSADQENSKMLLELRIQFLDSMKKYVRDYQSILADFCSNYINEFEGRISFEHGERKVLLQKMVNTAKQLLSFLQDKKTIVSFKDCFKYTMT